MRKHDDGSVTLTKEELGELKQAYIFVIDLLDDMPWAWEDGCNDDIILQVRKFEAILNGKEWTKKDENDLTSSHEDGE